MDEGMEDDSTEGSPEARGAWFVFEDGPISAKNIRTTEMDMCGDRTSVA